MTVTADILRDRIDDVIADMERRFAGVAPTIQDLIDETLRGDKAAYQQLQSLGRRLIAPMIDQYGIASGTLAAEWYDLNRDLLKVGGNWSGATLQGPNVDTGPLIGGSVTDFTSTSTILSGIQSGMDMRVRQAAQGTLMDSVMRDPQARGWGRVTSAKPCPFCAMLAGRGAVYRTRQTATFMPHLHCACSALPLWKADPTGESMRSREDTISTRRALSDKQRASQNAQARQWIADNKASLGLIS